MPEITWETLFGALALVALVVGAQYVRTSSSSGSPVKQVVPAPDGNKAGAGKKKKGKGRKAVTPVAGDVPSGQEKKQPPAEELAGSYADVAEKAAQQAGVGHDEVIVPAAGKTVSGKKKNKKAKAVGESSTPPTTAPPAQPDTSNDASLAAVLSAQEPHDSSSSEQESDPAPAPAAPSRRDAGGWEKPKKPITTATSDSAWDSSVPRSVTSGGGGGITSTNRFSALSISLPASGTTPAHAKKPLPRTSTTGVGKHRAHHVEEPAMTKLQKKNAAAAAAKKAAKEAEERERLERLARYRREQEREKINALYSAPKQGGSKVSVAANNRSLSNGMKASVDTGGKLVWD